MPYKVIQLSKLLINKDNDRFEPSSNEKEAVNVMLAKMGNKIYRIAQHILDNGLSPKPFYVVSFGDKFSMGLQVISSLTTEIDLYMLFGTPCYTRLKIYAD